MVSLFALWCCFVSVTYSHWMFIGGSRVPDSINKLTSPYWPSSRYQSSNCFRDGKLYIFGGTGRYQVGQSQADLSDLWVFELSTYLWTMLGGNSPSFDGDFENKGEFSDGNWPPSIQNGGLNCNRESLYLYAGLLQTDFTPNNFYIYNLTSKQWYYNTIQNRNVIKMDIPYSYYNYYFDNDLNSLYLIGAEDRIFIGNFTELEYSVLDGSTYSFPLFYSSSTVSEESKTIYIFGGRTKASNFNLDLTTNLTLSYNSLYSYNFDTNMQEKLSLYNASTSVTSSYGKLGKFSSSYFPSARTTSGMLFHQRYFVLVLFGGLTTSFDGYSDLWFFNLTSLCWGLQAGPTSVGETSVFGKIHVPSKLNHPGQRGGSILFQGDNNTIYLFGGTYGPQNGTYFSLYLTKLDGHFINEMWGYQLSSPTIPKSKTEHSSTYDTEILTSSSLKYISSNDFQENKTKSLLHILVFIGIGVVIPLGFIYFSYRRSKLKNFSMGIEQITESKVQEYDLVESITLVNTNIGLSGHLSLLQQPSSFCEVNTIGSGAQGSIVLSRIMDIKLRDQYGDFAVIKVVKSNTPEEIVLRESSIITMLSPHPNIVSLIGYTRNPPALILKYYPEGSLNMWMKRRKLDLKLMRKLLFDVAVALECMHTNSLAHCDIKSPNILVEIKNDVPNCVLTDFGIAQVLSENIISAKYFVLSSLRGLSIAYSSPDSLSSLRKSKNWNFKAGDIYSYGCVVYELLTGIIAWEQLNEANSKHNFV